MSSKQGQVSINLSIREVPKTAAELEIERRDRQKEILNQESTNSILDFLRGKMDAGISDGLLSKYGKQQEKIEVILTV